MKTPYIQTAIDANGNTVPLRIGIPLYTKKKRDGDEVWIVFSPHFKTFGYSKKNKEKAKEDFEKAIKSFFDIHVQRGTLEKALKKFGWEKTEDTFRNEKLGNSPSLPQPKVVEFAYA